MIGGLSSSEITTKHFSLMSVIKSIHSSTLTNVLTVLTTCRNFVMELRQSSFVSLIFPSSHTRWKFWTIRTLRSCCDFVFEGAFVEEAVVEFLLVAMMCVV